MHRFSRAMIALTLFGSMWMHGVLPVAAASHDMMNDMGSPSCLSHCLAAIHADSAHNATSPSVLRLMIPAKSDALTSSTSSASFLSSTLSTSFHDPWLILTTIKRE